MLRPTAGGVRRCQISLFTVFVHFDRHARLLTTPIVCRACSLDVRVVFSC
ncbi:MAG: hypothetical protein ACL7AX_04205 [Candidatus Arsenophonus phytopathogenicus]